MFPLPGFYCICAAVDISDIPIRREFLKRTPEGPQYNYHSTRTTGNPLCVLKKALLATRILMAAHMWGFRLFWLRLWVLIPTEVHVW